MSNWPQISLDMKKGYGECFGCGQDNPIGLKLKFKWDGKTATEEFTPSKLYQSWSGFVHGGIIICILDEAMSYAAIFEGMECVTAKMQVRLKSLAPINETLMITASVIKKNRKLVETKASIALKDGTLIAEGTGMHFVIETRKSDAGSDKKEPENNA